MNTVSLQATSLYALLPCQQLFHMMAELISGVESTLAQLNVGVLKLCVAITIYISQNICAGTRYMHHVGKKVKLSLCLTKHYAMKAYGGVDA
jgi:hypothetical protein